MSIYPQQRKNNRLWGEISPQEGPQFRFFNPIASIVLAVGFGFGVLFRNDEIISDLQLLFVFPAAFLVADAFKIAKQWEKRSFCAWAGSSGSRGRGCF